ncbi:hypothetical protein NP233_g12938 [Leucocoprinus birnbaumii]|uniref:pyranose dehydrogenase (acceptor) n=1 Tax=Leucocoprinus birnbaumii TaxID=56174 RepID=A0AAD5VDU1_9AGAR|nr:hypothetical protein NP233_g12938 [Leucocoprinus birnbaumii]
MNKHALTTLIALALAPFVHGAIYESYAQLPKNKPFDFVIIGGGTAGSVVANRLSANPSYNVLVLEAGVSNRGVLDSIVPFFSDDVVPFTPWDWNYTTVPQPGLNNRSIAYPRGYLLGGTSSVNYMTYTRGSSQDWDRYAAISGDDGWKWDNIFTDVLKAEKWVAPSDHHNTTGQYDPQFHNTTGVTSVSLPGYPLPNIDPRIIQTTKDLPDEFPFTEDYNSGNPLGVGWSQSTIDTRGRRSSAATSYLGPKYISRPNLHVLLHAKVTRLVRTGTKNGKPEILGVQFVNSTNTAQNFTVKARKELVLSAGSVNTPQLLQLSGIGDKSLLSSLNIPVVVNNPSVGRNLSDHPRLTNLWYANSNQTFEAAQRNQTLADEEFDEWQEGTGPLVDSFTNQLAFLRVPANDTTFWSQFNSSTFEDPAAGDITPHYELLFSNGIVPGAVPLPATGSFFNIIAVVVSPASRGSIMINSSNPLAHPVINPGFLTEDFDFEVMKYAVHSAQRFVAGPAWSDYILGPYPGSDNTTMAGTEEQLGQYVRQNTGTIWHPTATASMSPVGADWGVVDPDLLVKGVSGLRIVDMSVLPRVPAAHTQSPAYIVGERGASLVIAAWN